jgi:hypothetical protein
MQVKSMAAPHPLGVFGVMLAQTLQEIENSRIGHKRDIYMTGFTGFAIFFLSNAFISVHLATLMEGCLSSGSLWERF